MLCLFTFYFFKVMYSFFNNFLNKIMKLTLKMNFSKQILTNYLKKRYISNIAQVRKDDINKIRNIGISAHIDAGKTTTTERMLYYAGLIDNMGEVHHGNTVTDYMEQERERGITITSAAVTFFWKQHQFNLIDTPGHIDFTMEVEQTLNVLDGVVVILDGSAGVEAQTLTVWRQADRYNIPRIVYVNKMDRGDADVRMCCMSIEKKLNVPAVLLQLPAIRDNKIYGIVDVLSLELIQYHNKDVAKVQLSEKDFPMLFNEAQEARVKVIEQLTDYNDELANTVINSESFDNVSSMDIVRALQRVTLDKVAIPVTLGSSYKNIGVQSLMDSIILYLPPPTLATSTFEEHFGARAFKVKHDKQKGPLVFARIYNGSIKKGQKIFNVQKNESEQIGKVYVAYADDFKEMDSLSTGNIAVLSGLKKTTSGDLISTKKNISESQFGINVKIPEPVFFCSIEPPSMATQTALDQALQELQREDPSLRVKYDAETGQTVLGGMGELHLEIIQNRILKEYKIPADLGPLQIAYREMPLQHITDKLSIETKIGNHKNSVLIQLSISPSQSDFFQLKYDRTAENASNIAAIYPKHLQAVKRGIEVGLAQGPKISSQIINVDVILHWLEVGRGTSETVVASTATQLIQKLIKESSTCILEPVMILEIVTPSEYLSTVLSDLSRRRASVNNVSIRGDSKIVTATTPLAELLGYSTDLRTITSGTATFTTEFLEYQQMASMEEENAIRNVRGF